jgi:hypothetical protein
MTLRRAGILIALKESRLSRNTRRERFSALPILNKQQELFMSDDLRNKMKNRVFSRKKQNLSVPPEPSGAAAPLPPPPESVENGTLEGLQKFVREGQKVQVMSRPMTPEEREAAEKSQLRGLRLTSKEREILTTLGWKPGDPVPDGLSEEIRETFLRYAEERRAAGIRLEDIKIHDVNDLPPEERQRLMQVTREMLENFNPDPGREADVPFANPADDLSARKGLSALKGLDLTPISREEPQPQSFPHSSVPEGNEEDFRPGREADRWSGKETAVPRPEPLSSSGPGEGTSSEPQLCQTCGRSPSVKQTLVCSHCGENPMDNPDELPVSKEDKYDFLVALGSCRPFTKEYRLYGGTVLVRFRPLSTMENDQIHAWAVRKVLEHSSLPGLSVRDLVEDMQARISLILQIVSLQGTQTGSELVWLAPDVPYPKQEDWKREYGLDSLDSIHDHFFEAVPGEALFLALQSKRLQFNTLEYLMLREANNTQNFWEQT